MSCTTVARQVPSFKHWLGTLLCATIVIQLCTLSAGTVHAQVTVAPGQGVSFSQDDIQTDSQSDDESSVASVSVDAAALAASTGISSGYLNIADNSGNWVVQNMPIFQGDTTDDANFDLGTPDGTLESSARFTVSFGSTPVLTFTGGATNAFPLGQLQLSPQGEVGAPDPQVNVNVSFSLGGITVSAQENGVPNIQAADNQCAPAAFANDLTWLSTQYNGAYGIGPFAANVTGRGGATSPSNATSGQFIPNGNNTGNVPAAANQTVPPTAPNAIAVVQNETAGNSLVAALDLAMGRSNVLRAQYATSATSQTAGNGSKYWSYNDVNQGATSVQQLNGLTQYINSVGDTNKIGILTQGINTIYNNINQINTHGVATAFHNSNPTMNMIMNALSAGDTVKGGIFYNSGGGHAIDIIGAGFTFGQPWIRYQSDEIQTGLDDPNDTRGTGVVRTSNVSPNANGLAMMDVNSPATLGNLVVMYPIGTAVPEPSTWLLLAAGAAAIPLFRRHRHKSR